MKRAAQSQVRLAVAIDSDRCPIDAMMAVNVSAGRAWVGSSATAVSLGTGDCLGSALVILDAFVSILLHLC